MENIEKCGNYAERVKEFAESLTNFLKELEESGIDLKEFLEE